MLSLDAAGVALEEKGSDGKEGVVDTQGGREGGREEERDTWTLACSVSMLLGSHLRKRGE